MASPRMGAVYRQVDLLLRNGTVSGLSDRELIERFREGADRSESAFAGLVERHGPMVLGVCRSILRDPNDVDDAFQATFLVLVRRAGMLWVRDSIGPWLYGVAGRVALRARRDADRRRNIEELAGKREDAANLGGNRPHERAEAARMVHEELIQLPERWRSPLVLCHLEGLTHEQASRTLGVPVGTVRSRLSRGRERLKDRLIRRGLAPAASLLASGFGLGGEGSAAIVPGSLLNKTVASAVGVASGWALAGPVSVSTFKLTQGVLMSMFLTKMKTAAMILVIGGGTMAMSMKAGGVGISEPAPASAVVTTTETPKTKPGPTPSPAGVSETVPRSLANSSPTSFPKPIRTAVRIKTLRAGKVAYSCSGTIISSNPDESIILTGAGILGVNTGPETKPTEFPRQLQVELFEQSPPKPVNGADRSKGISFAGTVIDSDENRVLGLIRIKPGRVLPASPIVPPGWRAEEGMPMLVAGCPDGEPPAVWKTKILDPLTAGDDEREDYEGIECAKVPRPYLYGGGLFTEEGHLVGVQNSELPNTRSGIYATPALIYHILDRNGLKALYAPKTPAQAFDSWLQDTRRDLDPNRTAKALESVLDEMEKREKELDTEKQRLWEKKHKVARLILEAEERARRTAPADPTKLDSGAEAAPKPAATPAIPRDEPAYNPPTYPIPLSEPLPKPWDTNVRIRIREQGNVAFNSGTVISSTPKESIVLTCAHNFNLDWKAHEGIPNSLANIEVDLFKCILQGDKLATVNQRGTVEGTLIDCDFKLDLALIRIQPGRQLPALPIVSPRWQPEVGMELLTVGCSEGKDPTIWSTRVITPLIRGRAGNPDYEAIECVTAPKQGRSGGGLFLGSGSEFKLLGVCNFAQVAGDRGLYATTRAIYTLLARNQHQLLVHKNLRRFIATHNVANSRDDGIGLPGRVADDSVPPREPSRTAPADPTELSSEASPNRPLDPDRAEVKKPGSADIETRLKDVEQKLDRVLLLLEEKAKLPSGPAPSSYEQPSAGERRPLSRRSNPVPSDDRLIPPPLQPDGPPEANPHDPFTRSSYPVPAPDDTQRRLKDVEQKLERLFKLLEGKDAASAKVPDPF